MYVFIKNIGLFLEVCIFKFGSAHEIIFILHFVEINLDAFYIWSQNYIKSYMFL